MNLLERYTQTDYSSYEDFCNRFKINVPDNFNFGFDIIDEYARLSPNQRALIWCNDKGERREFTFGDISRLSNKAANYFKKSGIKKGDTVMLMLKRRYHFWFLIVALHKIGAIAIPSTHLLTESDLDYRIEAGKIKWIISANDPVITEHIDSACRKCTKVVRASVCGSSSQDYIDLDAEIEKMPDTPIERCTVNSDTMLIYFTSGTTSHPKMAEHSFTYPLGHIMTAGFWQNLKDTDIHFTMADTGWAKCAWGKLYGQWICGATVFVYDYDSKFQPADVLKVISENKITTFCAPPTIYRFLIKEDMSGADLSSLRASYTAGEPLNAEVFRQWKKLTGGIELREGFGQTETCVLIATFPWLTPKCGSTGKPSPHFNIILIDDNGTECQVGEEGEICIPIKDGIPAGIIKSYRENEIATKEAFHDNFYHTGDKAWMDEDGYYWFIGRSDDVIKSSGYRIGPFEVESALLEHPAVLEAAITALPDPERGQIVKATVVLTKNYSPSEELKKELQNHVKKVTAPYKYPRVIEFVDALPKTISGKIKRKQLRDESK